ncbi:MAG: hypothetical protein AAF311_13395 [Pseudomonadota bacterium]
MADLHNIGFGMNHLGWVDNQAASFSEFAARCQLPGVLECTRKKYDELSRETGNAALDRANEKRRLRMKASAGFFTTAPMRNGVRRAGNVGDSTLIAFDIDKGVPGTIAALRDGSHPLSRYQGVWYTTFSNPISEFDRVRIVMPVFRPLSPIEAEGLKRHLAHAVFDPMEQVDVASFRPTQLMFFPVTLSDERDAFEAGVL